MSTYGFNYNGSAIWARVYLEHGKLGVNADNVSACVAATLAPYGDLSSLEQWRMDYNQNGIYFECRPNGELAEVQSRLESLGFKRSKSAA